MIQLYPVFKDIVKIISFVFLICFVSKSYSQCGPPPSANCQGIPASELMQTSAGNVDFTFDSFSKFNGGITMSGSTFLRLRVLPNNPTCKWILRMYIDNNPGGGTPVNEWETLNTYGTSGITPALDLIEVKVYNSCNTPINSGVYQTFVPVNGSSIDIINDVLAINPAGSCITNVNGAGTYLTNYSEYNFTIDYRITPGLNFIPGMYQVSIKFCLVEDV